MGRSPPSVKPSFIPISSQPPMESEKFSLLSSDSKSDCELIPILPQQTGRYDVQKKVQRCSAIIRPGMFSQRLAVKSLEMAYRTPLSLQWSAFTHPEGNVYFHRPQGLSVVTESNMRDPSIAFKICVWVSIIEHEAKQKGISLTNYMELFVMLDGFDCKYYFADRAAKTIFWVDNCDSSKLDLSGTVSLSHLGTLLEGQFWTHIENFCMHIGGLPQKEIDDLILVFSHALADTLTSMNSTFPFEAPACEKFLNLLTMSRDRIHEGYTACYVARFWSVILYTRFETHHGEEQARLCRDTSILVDEYQEPQWVQCLVAGITFNTSIPYAKRLNDVFNDHFVYSWDWKAFMTETLRGWRLIAAKSGILLLLQTACFLLPVLPPFFYPSICFLALSTVTALVLVHKHRPLSNPETSAVEGFNYLYKVCSYRIKFQGVAFAYALPETFFIAGLLSSCSQAIYILSDYVPIFYMVLSAAVLGFFILIIHLITSGIEFPSMRRPEIVEIEDTSPTYRVREEENMV